MPTIGIKRDLLLEALGEKYSKLTNFSTTGIAMIF